MYLISSGSDNSGGRGACGEDGSSRGSSGSSRGSSGSSGSSSSGVLMAAADRNNSMPISEITAGGGVYMAPNKPEEVIAYVPRELSVPAEDFREALRAEDRGFVQLWLRVRRMNYEQLLWQLISTGHFRRDQAYEPANLPYWTIGMRLKVRSQLSMGRVMAAIRCRLGANCPGVRFCLDGFYGMRGYSDIFSSSDACPWMEVSNFSTAISLRLEHGDSLFISVASPAQIADVIEWRRSLAKAPLKEPRRQPSTKDDDGTIIGKIAYNSQVMQDLLL